MSPFGDKIIIAQQSAEDEDESNNESGQLNRQGDDKAKEHDKEME